nr:hypothetical protein [uncultured Chryseobacterium sp.]
MKKLLVLAAFTVTVLASAKNAEEKKETVPAEKDAAAKGHCQAVGMYVWCTDEMVSDTMCWGSGTGTDSYEQAVADQIRNAQLLTEFTCGAGVGTGRGAGN